jgi:tetratricopeptide (TPR) repeat protein
LRTDHICERILDEKIGKPPHHAASNQAGAGRRLLVCKGFVSSQKSETILAEMTEFWKSQAGQQKLVEAQAKIDRALQIFDQEIGEYFGLTWAALVRGHGHLAQGAYAEAKPFYERSLKAAHALNYRRTTQQAYDNLGDVVFTWVRSNNCSLEQ